MLFWRFLGRFKAKIESLPQKPLIIIVLNKEGAETNPEFETLAADLAGLLIKLCLKKKKTQHQNPALISLSLIFQQLQTCSSQARLFFSMLDAQKCMVLITTFLSYLQLTHVLRGWKWLLKGISPHLDAKHRVFCWICHNYF